MLEPPKLPRDILIEIIYRLPIETILRCRCVCRFWYSLINDSTFIDIHLLHHSSSSSSSSIDTNRFFIMNYRSEISRREHYSVRNGETFSEHMKLDFPFAEAFRVVDSCNGIICLSRLRQDPFSREIVLWNPSIKRSKTLLEISEEKENFRSNFHCELAIGFGYVPLINDFKVVHMVSHGQSMSIFSSIYVIHIYTLKQDSWRRTKALPLCFPNHVFPKALVKNTVHWMSSRDNGRGCREELILSFDLEKESFCEFPLPRFDCGCREPFISVLAYRDTLSLFHHCVGGQEQWEMWLMAEYGVSDTWVKHLVIRQAEILFPLGFLNGGEVVLVTRTNQVVSYESGGRQIRDLHLYGMMDVFRAVTYTGSLALLNNHQGKQ